MKSIFQNKALTTVIILLLAANLGLLAYYSFFKDKGHGRKTPVTDFVKNDLKFDEKQMKAFEQTKEKNHEKRAQLYEEIALAKDSLYQLVLSEDLDDSLLFDRALVVADKVRNLELEMFRQYKGIQTMCTSQQLTKFEAGFMPLVRKMNRPLRHEKDSSVRK